jgi:Flp pilus assembly pilin Flp
MSGAKNMNIPNEHGQSKIEYALVISLVAIVAIIGLMFLGPQIKNLFTAATGFSTVTAEPGTEISQTNQIISDFQSRILAYYKKNGRWPRTFSPYNFTDIGLNPADWSQLVNGLYFSPHGSEVGIANRMNDNIQVYVNDLSGKTLHLYDGWSIWCPVGKPTCYYHTVAPGNEIDINTIKTVGN